jgi:hypothetical protein
LLKTKAKIKEWASGDVAAQLNFDISQSPDHALWLAISMFMDIESEGVPVPGCWSAILACSHPYLFLAFLPPAHPKL